MESTPSSDSRAEIEERFQAAVSFIKSLPSADSAPSPVTLSNEDKVSRTCLSLFRLVCFF